MKKQKILQFIFVALCTIIWRNDIFTVKAVTTTFEDDANQTDSLEYFMTNLKNMTHFIGALAIQSLIAGGEIEADDVLREVVRLPPRFKLDQVYTDWEEVNGKVGEVVKLLAGRDNVDASRENEVQEIIRTIQDAWSPRLLGSIKKTREFNLTDWKNGLEGIEASWTELKEGIGKLARVLEKINKLEGTRDSGNYGVKDASLEVYKEGRKVFEEVEKVLKQMEETEKYGDVGKKFKLLMRTFSDAIDQVSQHLNNAYNAAPVSETNEALDKRKTNTFYQNLISKCQNISEFQFLGEVLTSTASPEPERTMMFTMAFLGEKKLKMGEEVKEWLKSHLRNDTNVTDQAVAAIWDFEDFGERVDEFRSIWTQFTEKLKGVEAMVKVVNEVAGIDEKKFTKDTTDLYDFLENWNINLNTGDLKEKLEECDEDVEKGRRIGEDIRWEVTWIREALGPLKELLSEDGQTDEEVAMRNDKIKGYPKLEGMMRKSRRLLKKLQTFEELTSGNQKLKDLNQRLEAFQKDLVAVDDKFEKIRNLDLNIYRQQSNIHSYMQNATINSFEEVLINLKSVGDSLRAVRTAGDELKVKANGHDKFWKLENVLETAWELYYAQEAMVQMHFYVNSKIKIPMNVEWVRVLYDRIREIEKVARRSRKDLNSVLEIMKVASRVNPSSSVLDWRHYLRNLLGGIRAVETMIKMFGRLNQVKKPHIRVQLKEKPIPIRRIIPFMFPNLLVALFICCVCVYVACFAPATRQDAELRAYHHRRFYKRHGRSSRRNRTERSR